MAVRGEEVLRLEGKREKKEILVRSFCQAFVTWVGEK